MPIWLIPIAKWLGHWAVYFILSTVVIWGLYAGLVRPVTKPNPTTIQNGGYSYTIHVGFGGCARLPVIQEKNVKH